MKLAFITTFMIFTSIMAADKCLAEPVPGSTPDMDIQVTIDLPGRNLSGTAVLKPQSLENHHVIVSGIQVTSLQCQGRPLRFDVKDGMLSVHNLRADESAPVIITFEKKLVNRYMPGRGEFLGGNLAGDNFMLLMSKWCPVFQMPAIYRLHVHISDDLTAISEADRITTIKKDGSRTLEFLFQHPRESLSLVVGRFHVRQKRQGDVLISTYFLRNDNQLADLFIDKAAYYIDLFSKRISPYPFKRFSIVENPAPSGLGFPTFTLIGSQILHMPFVLDISLGHEILHSWFGNSVYVDYSQGNWCEGLTSYLADYYFKEMQGKGSEYRHQILCDYKSYVHGENAIALNDFRNRTDRASKAVGYGKGAMVFHMLRRIIGDDNFFAAISDFSREYRFKAASWTDIQQVFSRRTHEDLAVFFSQWTSRKDIPVLKVNEASCTQQKDGSFIMHLTILQENSKPYDIHVPLKIFFRNSDTVKTLYLKSKQDKFAIRMEQRPVMAIMDGSYDVMRDLSQEEFPPSLSRLFGAGQKFIILAEQEANLVYLPIINFLKTRGFKLLKKDQLRHSLFKTGSFLVMGKPKGRLAKLVPEIQASKDGVVIAVRNNPLNPGQVTCALLASSADACRRIMFKLPHYGKYAWLKFEKGKITEKRKGDYEAGIRFSVQETMYGIESSAIKGEPAIIQGLSTARVVYLGEQHDQQGIHEAQLKIVKELTARKPVAVAMEMFQRPFQHVINEYLQGKLDEKTFLKKTEYFKRWGFNYHFYRPIVEFCRENNIPIIAMNLPTEVSRKIAHSGLDSLNHDEKKALPGHLDQGNQLYRTMLYKIYQGHESDALQSFQNFFQAQVAWDETMAMSIAEYIKENPSRQIVVIVGGGHVAYGYGIPSRVERRFGTVSQKIVLFPGDSQIDPMEADYFLFVPEKKAPFIAKLGVMLSGQNTLTVEQVVPGSPAAIGGIKKGDVIKALDGNPVRDIYDLKLELFFKAKGDKARVTVLRMHKDGKQSIEDITTGPMLPFEWTKPGFRFHGKR